MSVTLEIYEATVYIKPGWVAFDKKNKDGAGINISRIVQNAWVFGCEMK